MAKGMALQEGSRDTGGGGGAQGWVGAHQAAEQAGQAGQGPQSCSCSSLVTLGQDDGREDRAHGADAVSRKTGCRSDVPGAAWTARWASRPQHPGRRQGTCRGGRWGTTGGTVVRSEGGGTVCSLQAIRPGRKQ